MHFFRKQTKGGRPPKHQRQSATKRRKVKQVQSACETLLSLTPSTTLTSMIGGNRLERVATMVVKDMMIKGDDTVEFPTGGPVFINLLNFYECLASFTIQFCLIALPIYLLDT